MSRWIPITIETLYESSIAKLIDACSTKAKAAGQPDRVPGLIQGVVDEVRRKVGTCTRNRVDADETTVPKSLRLMAADLVVFALKKALQIELTNDEVREKERHETNLDKIAKCVDAIEQPDDSIEPELQSTSGTPSITTGRREDRLKRQGL